MDVTIDTLKERPDCLEAVMELNRRSWPEFLRHGVNPSWDRMYDDLSDWVILLLDAKEGLAAAGFTVPVFWDGTTEGLPPDIETIIVNGLSDRSRPANTLMAIAALVDPGYRGRRLSADILGQMKATAHRSGLSHLLVPVRPTWKTRYPLQSMEQYVAWQRPDGLCYDPWLRTHQRLGATIMTCVDNTMRVEGTIRQWQAWTGLVFPESGAYVVEGALQPVIIDVEKDTGVYEDPNVWMRHPMPS